VSTHEVKEQSSVPPRPVLRGNRSRWLLGLILACGLLLVGGVALRWGWAGPEPPALDATGTDPAIVAAVEEARARVLGSPRSAAAWGRLGMVHLAHGFRSQATPCLAQAERLDPREPRWPYFQALGALAGGDAERAVPKLEQALALGDDSSGSPRLRLAEALLSLDRLDEAENQFRHLLEKNPRHPRARLGLARLLYQRGDPRGSLAQVSFAQGDNRTQKAACQLLAQVHQQLGNPARAEEAQRLAAILPEDQPWPDRLYDEVNDARTGKDAWMDRARALSRKGQLPEALALFEQTVRAYPDADDAWLQLGVVYLMQKNQPAAEQALRRATEAAPDSYENFFYLGNALVLRGNLAEGITCFRKTTELKPDYAPAYHTLGNCLAQTGDLNGAIDAYRAAVRHEPTLFEVQVSLATLLAEKGLAPEALVHARQAMHLKPADPRPRKLTERLAKALFFPFFVP
jgi:tetratricopeptide (TPR) repeat protein